MQTTSRSLLKIAGFGFLAFAAVYVGSVYAKDRDIKEVVRSIRDANLDDRCHVKVDWAKSGGLFHRDFDLLVSGFPVPKNDNSGSEVRFDTCDEIDGQYHCVFSTEVLTTEGRKDCHVQRLIFDGKRDGWASRMKLDTVTLTNVKAKKHCSAGYFDDHASQKNVIGSPVTCTAEDGK